MKKIKVTESWHNEKSFEFETKTTTKEGIIRAIKKHLKELIPAIELYIGKADIYVVTDDGSTRVGWMENDTFGGGGTISIFKTI